MDTMLTDQAAMTSEGPATAQSTANSQPQGGEQTAQTQQGQTQQTTAEQKPEGGEQGAQEAKQEGEQKPQPRAPEKYEFKAADGKEFDTEVMGAFAEVARELDLSQEDAQKVLDKVAPAMAARQAQALETLRNGWAESSRTDKEIGGEKLDENLAVAKKAMDQFGTPELRTLLNESGLGNHPEVIRLLYRAGKAVSEETSIVTGGKATNGQTTAQRMYPGMNP